MVDSLPNPRTEPNGEVWLSTDFHGYCASTDLYSTVDWSVAPFHRNKQIQLWQWQKRTIKLEPSTELTDWWG